MDLPGEKLVIKLWETLAEKGIGSLLKPWHIGLEGRARNKLRRHEALLLAQTEIDVADIRSGKKQLGSDGTLLLTSSKQNPSGSDKRIEPTLTLSAAINYGNTTAAIMAARSEINATNAILFAEEQLAEDTQAPPDSEVNEDWLYMWREYAGKVSSEDLQRLWGSVLAGEVKAPGKYSIRTLEFLKTLSKVEAEKIEKLACYIIDGWIAKNQTEYLDSRGVSLSMLLEMQDLGVISSVEATGVLRSYSSTRKEKFYQLLISNSKILIVEHEDPSKKLELPIYVVTELGRQVLTLGAFEPNVEYLRLVGKEIVKQGFLVKLADWEHAPDNMICYFNEQIILVDSNPDET